MTPFRNPEQAFREFDAGTAATLVAAAADVALVLDADGVIRDLAVANGDLDAAECERWLDRPFTSVVTIESQDKVQDLITTAVDTTPRWRHVNHVTEAGTDLPLLYSAVPLGGDGRVLAVGRDMRPLSDLQQRLVDVQQSVERDYSQVRRLEMRYRLLFQMAREAVIVLDAQDRRVLESNPAASELLGVEVGETFPTGLTDEDAAAARDLLTRVGAAGTTEEITLASTGEAGPLVLSASLFRQDGMALYLLRVASAAPVASPTDPRDSRVLELIEHAPDGIVLTGMDGRVLAANSAFLEQVQLPTEAQACGESLERWLGRPGVDFNVLTANLREHGSVRLFATELHGEFGGREAVEISAVAVPDGDPPCLGFMVRSVGRRPQERGRVGKAIPHTTEQLKELVGRTPLKELVRESTDLIERMCIEAALDLTGDNRASAAEMLGLSRQSLYVKLRRYGLGDLDPGG